MEEVESSVAAAHAAEVPVDAVRAWRVRPTDRALVLGSAQPVEVVDPAVAARLGWGVTRRRSGGGVVAVDPRAVVWIEVALPAWRPEWTDDVGRAGLWLGSGWVDALAHAGLGAEVHTGVPVGRELGSIVCFAGTAPGEVVVPGAGKVVGISQRRRRDGARFQCLFHRHWDPSSWLPAVTVPSTLQPSLETALTGVVGVDDVVGPGASEAVVNAFAAWLAAR